MVAGVFSFRRAETFPDYSIGRDFAATQPLPLYGEFQRAAWSSPIALYVSTTN